MTAVSSKSSNDTRAREAVEQYLNKPDPPVSAGAEASRAYMWDFLAAVEDGNPLYWDEEFAKTTHFGGIIFPPQMLMTMIRVPFQVPGTGAEWEPQYVREREDKVWGPQGESYYKKVSEIIRKAGPYTFGTNAAREEEYFAPVHLGDRLEAVLRVTDVSPEKQAWIGRGVFYVNEVDYYNPRDGQHIARATNSMFSYDPSSPRTGSSQPAAAAPLPTAEPDVPNTRSLYESLKWDDVQEGQVLPNVVFNITVKTMMRSVMGTRHTADPHTDRDHAKRAGNRDIYLNTMAYQGFFARLVTDWAGPETFLRRLSYRMIGNNCPGDTMTIRGRVTKKYKRDGLKLVDVEARIDNQLQPKTTSAQMTVELI